MTLLMPGPNDELLLTEKQVADLTGFSTRTFQAWRLRGGGPRYMKLGAAVRYVRSDVSAWLSSSLKASTSDNGPKW